VGTSPAPAFTDALPSARYLLLTTYRRDGSTVATPVWFAQDGDRLLVLTDAGSGKVRRIRRDPRVLVSTCTFGGRATSAASPATASILPDTDGPAIRRLIRRRYRVQAGLLRVYSRLWSRGQSQSTYLAIRVT
jgi:uncharacterized protein